MAWLTLDSIRELVPAASPDHRASAGRFEASEVNAALE
jgi:hypothetical protein